MATRQLLVQLLAMYKQQCGQAVALESVGGVDAAKRVQAGEAFDVVILASDAIDKLMAAGHIQVGSKVDLAMSGVSVAVPAGTSHPDLRSEDAVREAVLAARSISYSTGPSGAALVRLFQRWGVAERLQNRIVQAPPGVPVGSLVARGEVELGFQQLSELIHLPGIDVVGPLPDEIQILTTFSGAAGTGSQHATDVRAMLEFMRSAQTNAAKREQGMQPA
jgi:molybdate transport system substrate-binding protein